jgi:5-methylcytosine-specific restriction endonuclease McrA
VTTKICSKCKLEKSVEEFYKKASHKDGLQSSCKDCHNILCKKWTTNNSEKISQNGKRWRQENKEYDKFYHQVWARNNPELIANKKARYRARKLKAMPKWLNNNQLEQIKLIYTECNIINCISGIKHHVDHIIPLQGKEVCGLHVPWNLQILEEVENLSKYNKLKVEYL